MTPKTKTPEKVEFKAPEGFALPEGAEAGKPFEVVCTLEAQDNGDLCLQKIGDTDMPGYDGKEEAGEAQDEARPDYKGMSQNMAGAMGSYGQDQGAGS